MVRAGSSGEHEAAFLDGGLIALTWGEPLGDGALNAASDRNAVRALYKERYPDHSAAKSAAAAGMISRFRFDMKPGDLVVMPRKRTGSGYSVGRIVSAYEYRANEPSADARHIHRVEWLTGSDAIPRAKFSTDILFSFGGLGTIYLVSRNDAEARLRGFVENGFTTFPTVAGASGTKPVPIAGNEGEETSGEGSPDLEEVGRDLIARHIAALYSGHGLATLVEAVLQAQGYTTYKSPPGPDGGMDLLAAGGPLGFGSPKILVQVKSGSGVVDHPVYTHMIGAMSHYGADQGLLVSWGGFRKTVTDAAKTSFFRVRLWNQENLIAALLEHYDVLPAEIRASIPLKRVWTLALGETI